MDTNEITVEVTTDAADTRWINPSRSIKIDDRPDPDGARIACGKCPDWHLPLRDARLIGVTWRPGTIDAVCGAERWNLATEAEAKRANDAYARLTSTSPTMRSILWLGCLFFAIGDEQSNDREQAVHRAWCGLWEAATGEDVSSISMMWLVDDLEVWDKVVDACADAVDAVEEDNR